MMGGESSLLSTPQTCGANMPSLSRGMDLGLHLTGWGDTAAFPDKGLSAQLATYFGCVSTLDINSVQIHEDSRLLLLPLTKNLVTVSTF